MTKKKNNQATQVQSEHLHKDEVIASIISTVNMLIAQASGADMGMAARILYFAKEELVHWAVDMDFHETSKDRFINRQLYENGLLALGELLARAGTVKDEKLQGEIVRMLGLARP